MQRNKFINKNQMFIDVTLPIHQDMHRWPGSNPFRLKKIYTITDGNKSNSSCMQIDSHCGTHVDAPRHFIEDGDTIESLNLEDLIGETVVVAIDEGVEINNASLEKANIKGNCKKLLIKTSNSKLWDNKINGFCHNFESLSTSACEWVVKRGIKLIGIDYLSVEKYGGDSSVHKILLSNGVIIVEGLDLSKVTAGEYYMMCMPLKVIGAEGAPARVVLRTL